MTEYACAFMGKIKVQKNLDKLFDLGLYTRITLKWALEKHVVKLRIGINWLRT
jgi:hypothetical protein